METISTWFVNARQDIYTMACYMHKHERVNHTLTPTALVNEAYVTLRGTFSSPITDHGYRLSVVSRTMSRILIDHARARNCQKRCGTYVHQDYYELASCESNGKNIRLQIRDALRALEANHKRSAEIAYLHIFGELSNEKIAVRMGVSIRTIQMDLRFAWAFIRKVMIAQ